MLRAYRPHAAFVAPARAVPVRLDRVVIAILLIEAIYGLMIGALARLLDSLPGGTLAEAYYAGDTAGGLLLQLCSFALLALATALVVHRLHGRTPITLIGPPSLVLSDFRAALIGVAVLLVAVEILPPWQAVPDAQMRDPAVWTLLLAPALLAILVQTGAEELLYRGYLQQQIAARFAHPLVWLTVPNVLFALAHIDNGADAASSAQYVIWAFAFGVAASDLTARTGSLGAAFAFHLANNAYAFLFWAEDGGFDSGLALMLYPAPPEGLPPQDAVLTAWLAIDLVVVWLMWLAARVALRR
jgi:hypothetical protein